MKCSMQFHPKVKWRREGNAFTCVTLANRIKIALVYNQNSTGRVTFYNIRVDFTKRILRPQRDGQLNKIIKQKKLISTISFYYFVYIIVHRRYEKSFEMV